MPETEKRGPDAHLANQAAQLRTHSRGTLQSATQYGPLQKLVVSLLLLSSLLGASWLLFSENSRQQLLIKAGEEWARLGEGRRAGEIFELPPPPPRRVQPQVVFAGSPQVDPQATGEIYQSTVDQTGQETIEKTFVPPQRTPGFEAAFKLLTGESQAASDLVSGNYNEYRYQEWRPVQNKHPEYFVSLVALRAADDTEVQFIWSVNTEAGRVTPLSQAARDLERGS